MASTEGDYRRLSEIGLTPDTLREWIDGAEEVKDFGSDCIVKEIYWGRTWNLPQDEWFLDDLNDELMEAGFYWLTSDGDPTDLYFGEVVREMEED